MIVQKLKYLMWIPIAILIVGLIVGFANGGLNLGIDFTGGSLTTYDIGEEFDTETVLSAVKDAGIEDAQVVKSGDNWQSAVVRTQDIGESELQAEVNARVLDNIKETYPNAVISSEDRVGATTSGDLVFSAFLSVLVACGLMLIYIWIRFELWSGIASVVALLHDVGIMTAVMAIVQMSINSSYIAACLTIVGYSINNTIVLLDRLRDNKNTLPKGQYSYEELGNMSIKASLGRTINTTITTLIMIIALYVLGVDTIKEFTLPIIIGLIAGTFSSVFLAVPMTIYMEKAADKRKALQGTKKKAKKKIAKKTKKSGKKKK